ncbi:uncharacterized protein CELE_Y50E8A.22 [Caenorhabditis elegans]|uniref:Secreted protein n=1 Tax=Caenorhabditis elegans TaxID=6239 RepID=A0A5K1I8S3_CAEEL|nr:Secreted protein [Caenorhabditis elegans]VWL61299.1 Secreted protein [Caenorhabditis elegans]
MNLFLLMATWSSRSSKPSDLIIPVHTLKCVVPTTVASTHKSSNTSEKDTGTKNPTLIK